MPGIKQGKSITKITKLSIDYQFSIVLACLNVFIVACLLLRILLLFKTDYQTE